MDIDNFFHTYMPLQKPQTHSPIDKYLYNSVQTVRTSAIQKSAFVGTLYHLEPH